MIDETSWYDDKAWEGNTKRYASLITHMDRAIGRLINELDQLGIRDNTLIVLHPTMAQLYKLLWQNSNATVH